ncbi:MAG: signal peptidase I [Lentisphaerae bacterium RIFOXYB12_FULL_65_16]|nr:MAG: signal peptidase I [Lentisphaerae bacterium RIFOXYA12_64_32]OGV90246.1 MAG: signal peptidase I [Lentisphaerae bacterium RIFOXYB12_FULL_65_16]
MIVVPIIFDILLVYLLFGNAMVRRFYTRRGRVRALLRDVERYYCHLLRRDRDILSAKQRGECGNAIDELSAAAKLEDVAPAEACLEKYQQGLTSLTIHGQSQLVAKGRLAWVPEYLEIFVVALALAFGIRGLFLQPFKIPTGSMQPTLYGIHPEEIEPSSPRPNPMVRFFQYLHYSRRYADVVVQRAGHLESIQPAKPGIPFFPATMVKIGGVRYRLPGTPEDLLRYSPRLEKCYRSLRSGTQDGLYFDEGEALAHCWLTLGDHLFVDRTYFAFHEPKRGDITVFMTDGIAPDLGGKYYIKRLVGLPGDELSIRDHKLYVKRPGDTEFRVVDESVSPAFRRIGSFQGGYRGYCHHPSSQYLRDNSETFVVPPNRYFMLGDNSENSRDSRFWGTVPRQNLVGRASFVWWPFLRRWGVADRQEPLDVPSPPNVP